MYHFFGMHDSTFFLTQVKFYPCTPHATSIQKELKWLKYGLRASAPFRACGEKLAKLELQRNPQSFIYAKKIRDNTLLTIK